MGIFLLQTGVSYAQDGGGSEPDGRPAEPAKEVDDADLIRGKEFFENGRTLYREARYREAIVAWQEALKLTKKHELLYNIASAQERLGEYDDAINTLNEYRVYALPEQRGELERRVNNLDRLSKEKKAEIASATPVQPVQPVQSVAEVEEKPQRGQGRRRAGLVLLGVGGAAIATGVVFGLQSKAHGATALESCADSGAGLICSQGAIDDLSAQRSQARVADISYVSGGVLSALGLAFVVAPGKGVSVSPNQIRIFSRF